MCECLRVPVFPSPAASGHEAPTMLGLVFMKTMVPIFYSFPYLCSVNNNNYNAAGFIKCLCFGGCVLSLGLVEVGMEQRLLRCL